MKNTPYIIQENDHMKIWDNSVLNGTNNATMDNKNIEPSDHVPQNLIMKILTPNIRKSHFMLPAIKVPQPNDTDNTNPNTMTSRSIAGISQDGGISRLTTALKNISRSKEADTTDTERRRRAGHANSLLNKERSKLWNQHFNNNSRDISFLMEKDLSNKPKSVKHSLEVKANNLYTPGALFYSINKAAKKLNIDIKNNDSKINDVIKESQQSLDGISNLETKALSSPNLNQSFQKNINIVNELSPCVDQQQQQQQQLSHQQQHQDSSIYQIIITPPNTTVNTTTTNAANIANTATIAAGISTPNTMIIANAMSTTTTTATTTTSSIFKSMIDSTLLFETMDINAFIQAKKNLHALFKCNITKHNSQNKNLLLPSGRKEIEILKENLYNRMNELCKDKATKNKEFFCEVEKIFSYCLNEIMRQVSVHCSDRGLLLQQIFSGYMELIEKSLLSTIKERKTIEKQYNDEVMNLKDSYEKELQKYKQKIEELNQNREDLESKLIKTKAENSYLTKSINRFEIECGKLIKKIEELKANQSLLGDENRILKDIIEEKNFILSPASDLNNDSNQSNLIQRKNQSGTSTTITSAKLEEVIMSNNDNDKGNFQKIYSRSTSQDVFTFTNGYKLNESPKKRHPAMFFNHIGLDNTPIIQEEPISFGCLKENIDIGNNMNEEEEIEYHLADRGTQTCETCLPGYRFKKTDQWQLLDQYKQSEVIKIEEAKNELVIIKKLKANSEYELPRQSINSIKIHPESMENLLNVLDNKNQDEYSKKNYYTKSNRKKTQPQQQQQQQYQQYQHTSNQSYIGCVTTDGHTPIKIR